LTPQRPGSFKQVHIWLQHGGHAGRTLLTVRGTCFSFWSDSTAGKKDLTTKRSHAGSLMQVIDDDIVADLIGFAQDL
jgi:ABC-type sulfate transport system substrate-binding protein